MPRWDHLWTNANLATMTPRGGAHEAPHAAAPYGAIRNAALAVKDGRIAWVGPMVDLPDAADTLATQVSHVNDHWITPGLVDPHTHLVFGGKRAGEFERRTQGVSYEQIAREGGGILSTVKATRETSDIALLDSATDRLRRLHAEGVTTVDIKSGYGLEPDTELKMLRVARQLGDRLPITIRTTFLGAHAVPPEYERRPDAYIDLVINEMLPAVADAGLADAVDAFCERIAFTPEQTARVFDAAQAHGLPVALHADQLSDSGGAALAARFRALSADHLEFSSEAGVRAMADAGTVAVLLPGAWYFTHTTQRPPVEALRTHGIPIAIATDCNPGSSPALSILLMLNMACTLFGLTPEEALAGVTRHAARALGLDGELGSLDVGKRADLAIWAIDEPAELAYWMGANPCIAVEAGGAGSTATQGLSAGEGGGGARRARG